MFGVPKAPFLLASIVLGLACTCHAASDVEVRKILAQWIGDRKGVGIAVGIVHSNESQIIGQGTTGGASDAKVDGDTVFEIGSVTKVFTSLLLADMVQKGEVKLDTPVANLLPPEVKMPTKDGKPVTLLQLATHTAGFRRMPSNFAPKDWKNPYADYTVSQLYEYLAVCALTNSVGGRSDYSNIGAGLLGHALGLKAGKDYETLVMERICQPLEMRDTRIRLTAELQTRLAAPHDMAGKATTNWDIPTLAGAGALRSTASDMLKLVAANLGIVKTSLTPAMEDSHQPRAKTGMGSLEVCLGWHLLKKHGREIVWHNGETGGYHSFIGLDKQKKIGVVVLANFTQWIDDIGLHLIDERFEAKPPKPAKP